MSDTYRFSELLRNHVKRSQFIEMLSRGISGLLITEDPMIRRYLEASQMDYAFLCGASVHACILFQSGTTAEAHAELLRRYAEHFLCSDYLIITPQTDSDHKTVYTCTLTETETGECMESTLTDPAALDRYLSGMRFDVLDIYEHKKVQCLDFADRKLWCCSSVNFHGFAVQCETVNNIMHDIYLDIAEAWVRKARCIEGYVKDDFDSLMPLLNAHIANLEEKGVWSIGLYYTEYRPGRLHTGENITEAGFVLMYGSEVSFPHYDQAVYKVDESEMDRIVTEEAKHLPNSTFYMTEEDPDDCLDLIPLNLLDEHNAQRVYEKIGNFTWSSC